MKKCSVITGFCDPGKRIKEYIETTDIIAADSGYDICLLLGKEPVAVLGDFDSLAADKASLPDNAIKYKKEKDETDTLLAAEYAINNGYDDITVIGGIGGRADHSYANIQTLDYIVSRGKKGRILTEDTEIYILSGGEINLSGNYKYISVFSLYEKARGVTLKGLKYPLCNAELTSLFPIGVSNEPVCDKVSISVSSGKLLIIAII